MKRNIFIYLGLFLLLISSCQSTKNSEQKTLDFSRNGGKTLDSYWASYFKTQDTYYLDQIMAYAESDDILIERLNEAFSENKLDATWIDFFSLTNNDGVFTSNYDMDTFSVFLLMYGDEEIKKKMTYLYSFFSQDLLFRNAVKGSAYWSLNSNADQREDVKNYLKQKLPEVSSKTRKTFEDILKFSY